MRAGCGLKKYKFEKVFVFVVFFIIGCSSDFEVHVRPEEAMRGTVSADLTRRVDIRYRDASGNEAFFQSSAMIGLSQPVELKKDSLADLEWSRDGLWEASAFSQDGVLLLHGQTQADPDRTDVVEITLTHPAGIDTPSAILRSFRTIGFLEDKSFDAKELSKTIGTQNCLTLPAVNWNGVSGAALDRGLFFSTATKSESVRVKIEGQENQRTLSRTSSGEAFLNLTPILLDKLAEGSNAFRLQVYTSSYEGCLQVPIGVSSIRTPDLILEHGPRPLLPESGGLGVSGYLRAYNMNAFPVTIRMLCHLIGEPQKPLMVLANGASYFLQYQECAPRFAGEEFQNSSVVPPFGNLSISVCGYGSPWGSNTMATKGFSVQCCVRAETQGEAISESVEKTLEF